MFSDRRLSCEDPFFREHERNLRILLFHHTLGDDHIFEPWIVQKAAVTTHPKGLWGVEEGHIQPESEGGAWKFDPPIRRWEDAALLCVPEHRIDEPATERNRQRLEEAMGDILEVALDRGPAFLSINADISYHLAQLLGLEKMMVSMIEDPERLHGLLAFMRDGILKVHRKAESRGDFSLLNHDNQVMSYSEELESPQANGGPRKRNALWAFCAAQEFALVSPSMHEEFLLQYQRPIIEEFGLSAYGCCEDLTEKIPLLRRITNLRRIAVTPSANIRRCAEKIGDDYVISWRPNPALMVCCGFDEDRIRDTVLDALRAFKGCYVDICLKDVETVEGHPERLTRWVQIVRDTAERFG
jgi:hypothetical protein